MTIKVKLFSGQEITCLPSSIDIMEEALAFYFAPYTPGTVIEFAEKDFKDWAESEFVAFERLFGFDVREGARVDLVVHTLSPYTVNIHLVK